VTVKLARSAPRIVRAALFIFALAQTLPSAALAQAGSQGNSLAEAYRIIASKQFVDLTHSFGPLTPPHAATPTPARRVSSFHPVDLPDGRAMHGFWIIWSLSLRSLSRRCIPTSPFRRCCGEASLALGFSSSLVKWISRLLQAPGAAALNVDAEPLKRPN